MCSDQLQNARNFETLQEAKIPSRERPVFHVTGPVGWINDPNGFSVYKGEYHLFFQYHPYSNQWGPMHWGHVKSRDLIRWERLPAAMAPDSDFDGAGCFSGSAVELPDGRHMLMYTGVQNAVREDGTPAQLQAQCIAFGDGVEYEKYPLNPVISAADLPEGASDVDFRDPKFWREADGSFAVVVANDRGDNSGQILLYRSPDALHWHLASVLAQSDHKLGNMWECPDFFPLEEKHVLILSPMEMEPQGLEFHPGHNTMAQVGRFADDRFDAEWIQTVDYGTDFYAPQTLASPDGRRILIGWMQNWATSTFVPRGAKYYGQLTLPRELSIRDGRLCQQPVRELEQYRGRKVAYQNVSVTQNTALEGVQGRVIDLTVTFRPGADCRSVTVSLCRGGIHETAVTYSPKENILRVDRSRSGYRYDIVHTRDIPVQESNGELEVRMILDRFSLELFTAGGRQAASFVIFTPEEEDEITFSAQGNAAVDVEKYDLLTDMEEQHV